MPSARKRSLRVILLLPRMMDQDLCVLIVLEVRVLHANDALSQMAVKASLVFVFSLVHGIPLTMFLSLASKAPAGCCTYNMATEYQR